MQSYSDGGQSMEEILTRGRVTVMWSQSNLQPLQQNIQPGFQQNIYIQPSRQFMDLKKQKLYFRPVIQSSVDNGLPDLARKQMLGITPIDSQSFWTLQSFTISGQQVLSQSQSQLQRTRSIYQAYYNSMTAKPKKKKLTGSTNISAQSFSGSNASTTMGFQKNLPTHPLSSASQNVANMGGIASSAFEGYECTLNNVGVLVPTGNYFPRAIISRHKIINTDFNCVQLGAGPAAVASSSCNTYFASEISVNGDAQQNGGVLTYNGTNYPNLARSTTPGVNVYMAQQSRFEECRRRFLTQIVTPFHCPLQGANGNPNTQTGVNTTISISQNTGAAATAVQALTLQEQYCLSVQNGAACYQNPTQLPTTTVGSSTQRQFVQLPTAANSTYVPPELYSQMEVSLGELSMEIDQLPIMCLENKSIQIQLQANLPQNVLSAFLQPSLYAQSTAAGAAVAATNGPSTAQCAQFLQACTLGSGTYQITDMIMRLEYIDFPQEHYEIVKKFYSQPAPYMSLRMQLDPLPIDASGTFTQRIAINNPIVVAFVCFVVPTNNNKATYLPQSGAATTPLAQDCVVNPFGCNIPTDLRGTYLDSYPLTLNSYYIDDGSGRRFESNDVNIANGQFSTYLRTMDGLQTAFNRYLDLDFAEWNCNRGIIVIPFNIHASPELALTSSQVILSLTVDNSARIANSKMYGECNSTMTNQFSLLTFAVTAQSLVDGVVRV